MSSLKERPPVTMVDYGGSNLRSVQKAFEAIGVEAKMTESPDVVSQARLLVLPGVGAFQSGMNGLRSRGLDEAVIHAAAAGTPLLGICLGMQLLFDASEEMGHHVGLGLLPGRVLRFDGQASSPTERGLKVPHMGWNQIEHAGIHPLLDGIPSGSHAYFVHSYYCAPAAEDVIATADYGVRFAAIAGRGNILGIQFHPEKSQTVGLRILENFTKLRVS